MNEKIEKIEQKIEKLKKDFSTQLSAIAEDKADFHKSLVEISSKHPEYSELISFMVFINDKMEIHQHLFKEIILNAINDLADSKKDVLMLIKDNHPEKVNINNEKPKQTIGNKIGKIGLHLKDIKWILLALAVIGLIVSFIINPVGTISLLEHIPMIKF